MKDEIVIVDGVEYSARELHKKTLKKHYNRED